MTDGDSQLLRRMFEKYSVDKVLIEFVRYAGAMRRKDEPRWRAVQRYLRAARMCIHRAGGE